MDAFSPLSSSPPVSDPALSSQRSFPLPSPPVVDPIPATVPSPSRPLIYAPPPATVQSSSRPLAYAPPPSGSPLALPSTPPPNAPQPLSPVPPTISPSLSLPIPPAEFPPPSSPVPPAEFSPVPPTKFSPPSPIPPDDFQLPSSPPSSPSPPAYSPPPSSSSSVIQAASSPPPPSLSLPSPRDNSPPPPTSPSEFTHTRPFNPPPRSSPSTSFSPPFYPPPRSSPSTSFSPPLVPSRKSKLVPPRNTPSIPRRPILSPPSHTPPSLRHAKNASSPPVITMPPPVPVPPSPASTNTSSPQLIVASPSPFSRPAPSPSQVLISSPGSPNDNHFSHIRPSSNAGIGTGGIVGITALLGIVLLTIIITFSWCLYKRKKKITRHNGLYNLSTSMSSLPQSSLLKIQATAVENGNMSANDFVYSPQEPGGSRKFTYEDLHEATNGFASQNLLGSGGFGYVYKGVLVDGTEVAVKELKIGSGQGEREFSAEVEIISRIHHRYLVSLVGYCISENKRLLVYEYVPNNTLYYHLHVSEMVLDWPTRVRVASGAARGIAYLHEDCHPRVIHRDIKSSNILLDENFEARVSDFGLAKLAADLLTHVSTRVMGTFGYLAPEYARSGQLSEKSDVFSFGVVLLELITGRKPVDASQPMGDEGLVEWARPLLSHALETEDFKLLVDPRLGTNFVPHEMFRMIEAAAACIRHSATKRPRMGQIVRAFENLETEDLNNGMRVGESDIYNSAQQSEEIKLFHRMAFGSQNYSTDYITQGSWATNSTDW